MTEKLTDTAKKLDLSEKNKLMATIFPGMLFGFAPANLEELKERLDCPYCMAIAEKTKKLNQCKLSWFWRFRLYLLKQISGPAKQLCHEIKVLERQDTRHWDNGMPRIISTEFVTAYALRDEWESS